MASQPDMAPRNAVVDDRGSLPYEPYFGLHEKAFSLLPNPKFFFPAAPHKAAFNALLGGIRRKEGILALTGEVGTGKTTLCRAVLDALDRKTFAAFVRDPILSREDLLKTLLVDFGVVSIDEIRAGHLRGASWTELSYPLYDFLIALQPLDAFAVVMIDEAQNIPATLLEEIRILSDLENGQTLLQLMLIGQPELDARLALPEMRQLNQRVSVRCELSPLTASDVKLYIAHRLTVAGNGKAEFSEGAVKLITAASAGVPRLVNLLCDRAMLRAAETGASSVNADHVIGATNDLRLPAAHPDSIFWVGAADVPLPAVRSSEAPGDPQVKRELNLNDLEPSTPAFDPNATLAEQPAVALSELAPPVPATSPITRDQREVGVLGLLASRNTDSTNNAVQHPLRRGVVLAASVAALVIVVTGGWLSRRYLAASEQNNAGRDGAPFSTTAAPVAPPALEGSVPSAQAAAPIAATSAPSAPVVQEGQFVVQMATFRFETSAAKSVQEFRDAGFPAYSMGSTLADGNHAIAVFVGPYADLANAEKERDRAQQLPGYGVGRIVKVVSSASVR